MPSKLFILSLFCACFLNAIGVVVEQKVVYTFAEFPYKESAKNVWACRQFHIDSYPNEFLLQEAMFREYEATCENGCSGKKGVSKVLCIRQCVSPSCYKDLYQLDQVFIPFQIKLINLTIKKSLSCNLAIFLNILHLKQFAFYFLYYYQLLCPQFPFHSSHVFYKGIRILRIYN